jgi:endonuclease-3
MASSNRRLLLTKSHKVLKKHFKPVAPSADRDLLEHLLLACCLEHSTHDHAEQAYSILTSQFFDWNEVRVSARRELAEALSVLTDPENTALRLRGALQSVFESNYSFDLEAMKKQNIGQAVKTLAKHEGSTPFILAYVTQVALSGHAIPLNGGALTSLVVIGAISKAEADRRVAPGLERAIPKSKGIEYASLLHQLGVQLSANPYSPAVRQILLEIAPDCKDRLPKRPTKKKPVNKTAETAKKKVAKRPETKTKAAGKDAATKKKAAPKKKPAEKKKSVERKKVVRSGATKTKADVKKKASTNRLSKRKPR